MTQDRQTIPKQDQQEFSEEQASLFKITLGPLIWAVHFVLCYTVVAVTCAKGWDIGAVRLALIMASLGALAGIAFVAWSAWRQWNKGKGPAVHDRQPEQRHHFLGHAAFLLTIISAIGVVFVSMPLILIGGCQ